MRERALLSRFYLYLNSREGHICAYITNRLFIDIFGTRGCRRKKGHPWHHELGRGSLSVHLSVWDLLSTSGKMLLGGESWDSTETSQ